MNEITKKEFDDPLKWRKCSSCKGNLVDAEISEALQFTCEPGAFHSKLLGGRNPDTWQMEYWKCPHCNTVFLAEERPVIHTMSDAYL
jgi:hypothetical protein